MKYEIKKDYDFYKRYRINSDADLENLIESSGKYEEIEDSYTKTLLLGTALDKQKDKAKGSLKKILRTSRNNKSQYNAYIKKVLKDEDISLHIINSPINLNGLPSGSWALEIPITLKTPFFSRDDTPFYVNDNPVRKDKVFKIPITSAMSWKGNLRWVMMKVFLENEKDPDEFAKIRFQHSLLFGTEKGWNEKSSWTKYLDGLCSGAEQVYKELVKDFFKVKKAEDAHFEGMLRFYPTFWDKIDMTVINPHDRKSGAGKIPINFEVVPKGAKGVFRLLYVPIYWLGLEDEEIKKRVLKDLSDIVQAVEMMILTYGFSAKKSLGYGIGENIWEKNSSKVEIKGFFNEQKFVSFDELNEIISAWREKI